MELKPDLIAQISPFPWSPGHAIQDLNYLLLLLDELGYRNLNPRILVITPLSNVLVEFVRVYRPLFSELNISFFSLQQGILFNPQSNEISNAIFGLATIKRYLSSGLFLDASTSHCCPIVCSPREISVLQSMPHALRSFTSTNGHVLRKHLHHNLLNLKSSSSFLSIQDKPRLSNDTINDLKVGSNEYVLFYYREKAFNGCYPISFESYNPCIDFFRQKGYKIIFPNTDSISIELRNKLLLHDILIYSDIRTSGFKQDLELYANCSFYFGSNCGPASAFTIYDIPMLWCGQWISPGLVPPILCGLQIPTIPIFDSTLSKIDHFRKHVLLPVANLPEPSDCFLDDFTGETAKGRGNPFNSLSSLKSVFRFLPPNADILLESVKQLWQNQFEIINNERPTCMYSSINYEGRDFPLVPISKSCAFNYK